jgi:cobalt/nickel transport system ATP-binding protein
VDAQLFCSTVDDELAFGPRHLGMSEDEICRRTEDLVALFNLSEIRGRQPQHLSGGEKRRVGLASVLAVGPSVVLLDEPTSGLDPRNRAFLVDMLLGLSDAGRTVVIATHDLDLARDVTTKSVVISEDHCLAAAGETSSVLDDLDLLEKVNLIHVHEHSHGGVIHVHPHSHGGQHNHEHQEV